MNIIKVLYINSQLNCAVVYSSDVHYFCKVLESWVRFFKLPVGTQTHTRLTALFPGLPRWADTRKVEPIWILLKQEKVSGSSISWAICKSAPCSRQTTTPAPHHSVFLQAGCPSCRPTNSVKALKAKTTSWKINTNSYIETMLGLLLLVVLWRKDVT